MSTLIGVDVGGTFTDIVYYESATRSKIIHKVATTPDDPSVGVIQGIVALCSENGIAHDSVDQVYHGTTIATNAILEYKGARAGMITTRGFRDIIHIGRHQRPQHYSIMQEIPWQDRPLVRREFRKVVDERIAPPNGETLVPLNEVQVRDAARGFKEQGVNSVAICFLFSYLNPAHEERAREIVLQEHPDAFVTTSSAVSPQFREFERFTTAALNAFVGPLVRDYINRLGDALGEAGFAPKLHVMLSNGGVGTVDMVSVMPIKTLLSGPAAGVLCGLDCGRVLNRDRVITFDVGGTSADISVITNNAVGESSARDTWIGGYPALVPMIDIHTIGAGGGSIAFIDSGGGFRVGPESAGASPGPVAYGRGGSKPTVTDANLVLGRLDPDAFLGGGMHLDADGAWKAVAALGERLNLSAEDTAAGILAIVNNHMANAIRSRTVQKGIDPREYALVAFGGAGPLHAVEVASMLSIPEVIVPEFPGIGSAVGLLTTDIKYDVVKTVFQTSDQLELEWLNEHFTAMEETLRGQFENDGVSERIIHYTRFGEFRYAGQGYELRIEVPAGQLTEEAMAGVFTAFHAHHETEYGHCFRGMVIEVVNLRVTGVAPMEKIDTADGEAGGSISEALIKETGCKFRVDGTLQTITTGFYRRDRLPIHQEIDGPAIILQKDSTTVVPPGCRFQQVNGGNLVIRAGAGHE